jgi:hypothetical protein
MWICISTIQKYYRLKPRPFWISSKYNSWIAENCNLLDLLLSILTDMAEMYLQLPYTAIGCQQYLPPSVVQLKGKHCLKPHCLYGVLGMLSCDWWKLNTVILWLKRSVNCSFSENRRNTLLCWYLKRPRQIYIVYFFQNHTYVADELCMYCIVGNGRSTTGVLTNEWPSCRIQCDQTGNDNHICICWEIFEFDRFFIVKGFWRNKDNHEKKTPFWCS